MIKYGIQQLLAILGACIVFAACVPPTPPPSPTPWPSSTPVAAKPGPTATALPTPVPTATLLPTATSTHAPLLLGETPSMTTLTVWENLPEGQLQQLTDDVRAFQTEFPQYTISLQHYDSPENFMTPLMAGQTEFDVILASSPLLGSLWATEQILPMSNFFPPGFMDSFAAITLSGATQNSNVWGLPETAGFHLLLFYNKDLVDTPPATTDELFKMGQSLTTASQWGLGVNSYDPLWVIPWLGPYGGRLTDAAGNPTLNSVATEESLALFQRWHAQENGIAPIATYDEMQSKFLNGDMAMMITGDWALGELASKPELNWGVALLPSVGNAEDSHPASPLVLGKYWAIGRNATEERAPAATTFLEYITRPERQLAWTAKFGLFPTQRQVLNDPLIVNDSLRRVSAAQMRAGQAIPLSVNLNFLLDAMREPLRGLIDGELSPKEAGEMMQANATQ